MAIMRRRLPAWVFPRFSGVITGALVTGMVCLIVGMAWVAGPHVSWRWVFGAGSMAGDPFDLGRAGLLPLLMGTAARTVVMALAMIPAGVLTGVYLAEYAPPTARLPRLLRGVVQILAGVPGVIFGLFGLGFLVGVLGGSIDRLIGPPDAVVWGKPGLLWASWTLALMTLPVVVIATEEALRSVPRELREAAIALGATRFEVLVRVLLPEALPGIATGVILAIGRASGEVVPLLFTGAAVATEGPPVLSGRFMDLAYQVFVLATQSPDPERSRPLLLASVWVLVFLSLLLNAAAAILRHRVSPPTTERL